MKPNITNYTCNGKCSGCGQCCGDILHLSKKEIHRIDRYLKEHKVEATPRIVLVSYDNTCPFRDNGNKKCKIYEVRPDICRVFQCNKTPEEAFKNREITNSGKLPRSMRNLFFGDTDGASWLYTLMGVPIYDRNDNIIGRKG
jgi:Fe-S-cluster containining protein